MTTPARKPNRIRPMLCRTVDPSTPATLAALSEREGRSQGEIIDRAIKAYAARSKLRKCAAPDVGDASNGGEVAAE